MTEMYVDDGAAWGERAWNPGVGRIKNRGAIPGEVMLEVGGEGEEKLDNLRQGEGDTSRAGAVVRKDAEMCDRASHFRNCT